MLTIKKGQTYICTKSDKRWWTVGKEYPVFLDSDNEPIIKDDEYDDWHSSYLSISNDQFKLKEEQPKVTLDEPKKPVMPKFFDDWAKQVLEKCNKFYAISLITRAGWGYGVDYELGENENPSTTRELLDWLVEDSLYLNKEKAINALLYGYEVEKEPKYIVKIGKLYLKEPLGDTSDFTILTTWDKKCAYLFSSFHMADIHAAKFEGTVEEVAEG
ncbi:DUF1642 domain-containing protein [Enterococcus faecium]|uniref:DUF1642 domain-containing protein n=1 Tax=Enterococcus faecium TaxID=1352 RepID=UPI0020736BCD|nr:DUF1642 domain-containing protein [Enterococcus faecium]MCM6870392.1 DUF1642 domain-containing protein [Enterococcus faecium]MCM6875991.1 DUF1642 domain-containing protein [Enterococcus faecium]MCM6888723.1 DUF1642 domain-containing protein [Enterococcus faecium]MCM6891667.1 DUF1642 domain-containing protein [Enterococcus faecium]MCM6909218.1 DUF1642 domain-containing protein [Enterococcus faecium]